MESVSENNVQEKKALTDYVKPRDHKFCEENLHLYNPTPFYKEYSESGMHEEEVQQEKDKEYIKRMYPESAVYIMEHVEEECDKLEYEGSMMFDEYPDKWSVQEIRDKIVDKVFTAEEKDVEATGGERRGWGPGFGPGYGPGWGWGYDGPPPRPYVQDLVGILLFDEMHRRRCRYRRCRRSY